MQATLILLPEGLDADAERGLLDDLRHFRARHRAAIRDHWVLDARTLMLIADAAVIAHVPATCECRSWPRTTRWIVQAHVVAGGSRYLADGARVAVFEPEPGQDARNGQVRVLGPDRDGGHLFVRLPLDRLRELVVRKEDHPAMLWHLERDGRYWPATADAHARAVAWVGRLEGLAAASEGEPGKHARDAADCPRGQT